MCACGNDDCWAALDQAAADGLGSTQPRIPLLCMAYMLLLFVRCCCCRRRPRSQPGGLRQCTRHQHTSRWVGFTLLGVSAIVHADKSQALFSAATTKLRSTAPLPQHTCCHWSPAATKDIQLHLAVTVLRCNFRFLASGFAHQCGPAHTPPAAVSRPVPPGDMAEYRAIRSVVGHDGLRMNSTKSMIGHLLGGAGAVEAVATIKAIQTGAN